jgi:bacterioferritin
VDTGNGRQRLIEHLNEDLSREYQAVIAYLVYSQTLKGAEYTNIAGELENHAAEELKHALLVVKHLDCLGGAPTTVPTAVSTEDAQAMLRTGLENETLTVRNYRECVKEWALSEFAIAEDIRKIIRDEQEHLSDLASAPAEDVLDASKPRR